MAVKLPGRIDRDDASAFQAWALPELDGAARVAATVRKRAPAPKRQPPNANQPKPSAKDSQGAESSPSEFIEDVDMDADMHYQPMTAEALQAITEAAEKEGFDKGFAEGKAEGLPLGKADGYKVGYEEGLARAKEQAAATLAQQVAQLQQVMSHLMAPSAAVDDRIEALIVGLVQDLTQQLVQRELLTGSTPILLAVKEALAALPDGVSSATIYLHPKDKALIQTHAVQQDNDWRLLEDETLMPGGCRVETPESRVDYRLEVHLEQVLEQFAQRALPLTGETLPDHLDTSDLADAEAAQQVTDHNKAEVDQLQDEAPSVMPLGDEDHGPS